MLLNEFKIGEKFKCGDKEWLCTDIGTRVITAIQTDKPDWMSGPPYAIPEEVFDEYDIPGCNIL